MGPTQGWPHHNFFTAMDTHHVFSTKAEKYARYRWWYAPESIDAFCQAAGLDRESCLADIGAGTGILTRPLAGRVGWIYAVEPNPEMRREAEKTLAGLRNRTLLAASAEVTTLPDASLDAIVVAEAAHWFDFVAARAEFLRILKPGGWLGMFHNTGLDEERGQAMAELRSAAYGVAPAAYPQPSTPWKLYFNGGPCQVTSFPFTFAQNWEQFLGALISTSYMPDEGHPLYPKLEQAARRVFERFSIGDWLKVNGETVLLMGQPVKATRTDVDHAR